jgi:hypothetical protein
MQLWIDDISAEASISSTSTTIIGKYDINLSDDVIGKYSIALISSTGDIVGKYDLKISDDIIGKYDLKISNNIISNYDVNLSHTIIGNYGQSISQSLISKYDVIPSYGFSGSSRFVIEILDPVLEQGQFINLVIKKRLNQVHTFEIEVVNPDATLKAQLLYNAPIRVRVNDRLLFTGVIKRVDKQDCINVYKIVGEGGSSLLKDLVTSTTTNYEHTRSFYIIEDLLPATNWEMIAGDGGTDYGSYIDYTTTPGPVLNHISNICKMQNHDWDVTQIRGNFTSVDISGDTITLDIAPTPDGYYDNRYGAFTTGLAKDTGFTITDQTGAVLTTTGFSTLASTGDKVVLWGKYLLQTGTHLGSYATVAHYTINETAFDLERQRNLDKVVTSYIGVGQMPEVSRFITYATACTLNTASLVSTETYLTVNATTGSATLYASNTAGYTSTGTIQIGSELIQYTNKGATTFTGLTRAYNSTASATHYVGDYVLLTSALEFDDLSDFSQPGSIWLGAERIDYKTKDNTHIYTLTRGASDTPKYNHYAGTYAFDATYTDDSPQAGSMVGNYGVRRERIAIMGATTRDAMDKRVQQQLFRNATDIEYGSFKLLSTDFWQDIKLGDEILVTDYDGNDNYWRIIGVDYNQYRPITVYFGQTDDYILEDIARIDAVSDSAVEKAQLTQGATISQLSSDKKYGLVIYDDGSPSEWVELR